MCKSATNRSSTTSTPSQNNDNLAASPTIAPATTTTTTFTTVKPSSFQKYYIGGYLFGIIYLLLIATTVIHPMSAPATGTIAVNSWFVGFLIVYYNRDKKGLQDKWIRIEACILLSALFQLAVGAFAFSRLYNGPLLGHDRDVFHDLSCIYMREVGHFFFLSEETIQWWIDSTSLRFVGLGWYICDVADILVHQIPFVILCYIISSNLNGWTSLVDEMRTNSWVYITSMLAGPMHRLFWDYCNCGHAFCDGPYRGFLAEINRTEQFLWHLMPCVTIASYLVHYY